MARSDGGHTLKVGVVRDPGNMRKPRVIKRQLTGADKFRACEAIFTKRLHRFVCLATDIAIFCSDHQTLLSKTKDSVMPQKPGAPSVNVNSNALHPFYASNGAAN